MLADFDQLYVVTGPAYVAANGKITIQVCFCLFPLLILSGDWSKSSVGAHTLLEGSVCDQERRMLFPGSFVCWFLT
jgi:hypothetical protein